jgi:hypothetical protein
MTKKSKTNGGEVRVYGRQFCFLITADSITPGIVEFRLSDPTLNRLIELSPTTMIIIESSAPESEILAAVDRMSAWIKVNHLQPNYITRDWYEACHMLLAHAFSKIVQAADAIELLAHKSIAIFTKDMP